ncbi:hypothetical protein [Rhodococcus zopfii]|uniref:hypothetical protein n=1 Tax=Rhodococcus zopfii TaxID=43772 RepID=UPI003529925B
MPDTPDLATEILNNRRDLAQQGHDLLDTIETSATAGRAADVQSAVDQIHTVLDTLADLVVVSGPDRIAVHLTDMAAYHVIRGDLDEAQRLIETATKFGDRHTQLLDLVSRTDRGLESHTHYFVEGSLAASITEAAWSERRRRAKESLQYMRREDQ